MKKIMIVLLLCLILLSSCSTTYLVKPIYEETNFSNGLNYCMTRDNVRVKCKYCYNWNETYYIECEKTLGDFCSC